MSLSLKLDVLEPIPAPIVAPIGPPRTAPTTAPIVGPAFLINFLNSVPSPNSGRLVSGLIDIESEPITNCSGFSCSVRNAFSIPCLSSGFLSSICGGIIVSPRVTCTIESSPFLPLEARCAAISVIPCLRIIFAPGTTYLQ